MHTRTLVLAFVGYFICNSWNLSAAVLDSASSVGLSELTPGHDWTEHDAVPVVNVQPVPTPTLPATVLVDREGGRLSTAKNVTFQFKGIGINFVKSVISWKTFGVNVVLPITANFPVYDQNMHNPRATCYLGVYFPPTLSATLSISLPCKIVAESLVRLARNEDGNISKPISQSEQKHKPPSASLNATHPWDPDSVQRIGLRFSVRYDRELGLRGIVGPTVAYLPGPKVMEFVKPTVLLLPTLLIFSGSIATDIARGCLSKARRALYQWLQTVLALLERIAERFGFDPTSLVSAPTVAPNNDRPVSRIAVNISIKKPKSSKTRKIQRTRTERWTRTSKWLRSKSLGFVMNLGYFATSYDRMMGSNVIFELHPFFPLRKYWSQRRHGQQQESVHATSTTGNVTKKDGDIPVVMLAESADGSSKYRSKGAENTAEVGDTRNVEKYS